MISQERLLMVMAVRRNSLTCLIFILLFFIKTDQNCFKFSWAALCGLDTNNQHIFWWIISVIGSLSYIQTCINCLQVPEAEDELQSKMESESVGSYEGKESESAGTSVGQIERFDSMLAEGKVQSRFPQNEMKSESACSEETRRRRGKDLDWQQVERFDSPQAFNRSQIKAELDQVMSRSKLCRTSEARQERYVCKFYKKAAWKPCLRKYRVSHWYHPSWLSIIDESQVMYLNTSFEVVVLSTLDKHHHEEDPEFTTKENYHCTVQQEKVPPPSPQPQTPANLAFLIVTTPSRLWLNP